MRTRASDRVSAGVGRCGKRFMTTPLRRYFCEACFMLEERLGYCELKELRHKSFQL